MTLVVLTRQLRLKTLKHSSFINITGLVQEIVDSTKVRNGILMIQTLHTTTGIYITENEPRLLDDLTLYLSRCAPKQEGLYMHDNLEQRPNCPPDEPKNGHSHIKSALFSCPSVSIGLNKGKLTLGKYQNIFFGEFDGPCPRKHKSMRLCQTVIIGD
jgi:secondary thiamine-phosphate synthase enzyme